MTASKALNHPAQVGARMVALLLLITVQSASAGAGPSDVVGGSVGTRSSGPVPDPLAEAGGTGVTTRVSLSSEGAQGDDYSYVPSISTNGRFVAFASQAENLVDDDTNGVIDVFVHDRATGRTTRVSISSDGLQGDGDSYWPAISPDGRYVSFESYASNLVAGDTNGLIDVYLHDRLTGVTEIASVASDGSVGNGRSFSTSISADGRYVAFHSEASNLVANDFNLFSDVFVHDRVMGQTRRVSTASDGTEGNEHSTRPVISWSGCEVAFISAASNLVSDDINGVEDVFVHDCVGGQTTRVSVASDGREGDGASLYLASISSDGYYVVFGSEASNLVSGDTNDDIDVFVRDRIRGRTTRVSLTSDGTEADGDSWDPAISPKGRYVAFFSYAHNLSGPRDHGGPSVYLHDRVTGETTRVSVASDGTPANRGSYEPSLSAGGRVVAFYSYGTNLVSDDTNGDADVFVHELLGVSGEP